MPSSVWCQSGPIGERLCRFRNICFNPQFQEFQFFMTDDSVISGVQRPESWMNIDLSTVLGHNAFKLRLSLKSSEKKGQRNYVYMEQLPAFIIHRFKPDNLMHVIHDDLMPLYFTIQSIFDKTFIKKKQFLVVSTDEYQESVIDDWYNLFSGSSLVRLSFAKETICFRDAYVGLHRATLWFNYGFRQPQGPYLNDNFNVNGLKNFVDFSLNEWQTKLKSTCKFKFKCTKVVVLVRSQTRKILNLDFLIESLKKAHMDSYPYKELEIVEVDLAVHDMSSILSHIRQAKLLVGMHGAGMILSIFLPPSSAVVELFPFGINPENVSFLKALLQQQQSLELHYEVWQNEDRASSIPGQQNDPLLGSIVHLPVTVQNQIKNLSKVPAVKCCHDPAYLYFINHDTFVNDKIYQPLHEAFIKTSRGKSVANFLLSRLMFPALPSYVNCKICGQSAIIEWGPISNAEENEGVWFQITLLHGEHFVVVNVTNSVSNIHSIQLNQTALVAQVWFQPFNTQNVGGQIKHRHCI